MSKLGHGGSEDCHAETRSHVPRGITSNDPRRGSPSRSMRFHSKKVAVRIREHDHVGPVAQQFRRLEFVDEREDVAMIPAQQFPQMRAARGVALVAFGFAHRAGGLERLGNLIVQFHPVGKIGRAHV